ncbi:MAG: hypothetical protein K0R17_175 [Rariglobus sp.]|nr:hypothetical protein [Rariglobus sp.]
MTPAVPIPAAEILREEETPAAVETRVAVVLIKKSSIHPEPTMSKIKWNDDRIKQTLTALLLISRTRLTRGDTNDLVAASLLDYRNDPAAYKEAHWNKAQASWSDPKDLSSLKNPKHLAYYKNLLAEVDAVAARFKRNQIQFNSVIELDNYLVTYLKSPDF